MMYDASIFKSYFEQMDNEKIVKLTKRCLENAPHDFWEMPASTTGKYHPGYALGYGGLVRHTLSALYFACSMLDLQMFSKLRVKKSEILSALILHDTVKKGNSKKFTSFEHPLYSAKLVEKTAQKLTRETEDEEYLRLGESISQLIAAHMGQWNTSEYSKTVLPRPKNSLESFVHLCDYLASRKGDDNVLSYIENQ